MQNYSSKLKIFILLPMIFFGLFVFTKASLAATYYIDFQNGNDNNDGLTTTTAWKHIPGTRSANNTEWQSTSWGLSTINNSKKVSAGTTFMIKKGSTHNNSNGGMIWIDNTYYSQNANAANPIKFTVDPDWGSGMVTIDAANISVPSNYAVVFINAINGVVFDGLAADGIKLQNSPEYGMRFYGSSPIQDISVKYVTFFNNNTNYVSQSGVSIAHLRIDSASGVTVDHCVFDGNGNRGNGFFGGESHVWIKNATVSNSEARNINGTFSDSDGVGFKALSSQVTFINNVSHNNYKGFDLGEDAGDNVVITYKVINSTAHSNTFGINMNSSLSPSYSGAVNYYIINCLVYDNSIAGTNAYAGPYNLYVIHNVYANNGSDTGDYGRANIQAGPDMGFVDTTPINIYFYNNAFYKPAGGNGSRNYFDGKWVRSGTNATNFTLYSDYNSWVQTGSEPCMSWGGIAGSDETLDFAYGSNGPGHASGNWYNFYGGSANVPTFGLGHYHQDAHSKGTGASDTTQPPFRNVNNHDYILTARYEGISLSSMPWYIPEMGIDRNGIARVSWDIGAYEYVGSVPPDTTPPAAPKGLRVK